MPVDPVTSFQDDRASPFHQYISKDPQHQVTGLLNKHFQKGAHSRLSLGHLAISRLCGSSGLPS